MCSFVLCAAMTYIIPGRKSTGCPPLVWSCVQNSGERNGGSQNGAIKTKEDGIRNHEQQLDNVKAQISALQQKLNSLKEEKHSLFQRLKTVLNEEDEKRGKYEDHIHSEPRILGHEEELKMSESNTVRLASAEGLPVQQRRVPLLPTPDPTLPSQPCVPGLSSNIPQFYTQFWPE
ncbi:hypothetical protein GBAR_LOCUS10698 [Geodia barretti]|uniref:Uncharacterized protein n=1 Tax=Geodia barretti TaxID=519541 RepID=A0AA35RWS2_GEOBA|nr:hypothetical protein GBAR_LOCUS10698 [Geodia barretti]